MDLLRALVEQEETAARQNQVTPGKAVAADREDRRRQPHQPGNGGQQREPHEQGERKPYAARTGLQMRGQPPGHDGDEDEIVDAQNDFENREGQKARPDLRVEQPFCHAESLQFGGLS